MVIVVKHPHAELDLLDIWDYIADDSLDRVDEFLDLIESNYLVESNYLSVAIVIAQYER